MKFVISSVLALAYIFSPKYLIRSHNIASVDNVMQEMASQGVALTCGTGTHGGSNINS